MFSVHIILLLVCAATAQGEEKVLCNFSDSECMVKSSNQYFEKAIQGEVGKWNSSDPLSAKFIEGNTGTLTYAFSNIDLTGLTDCRSSYLSLNPETSKLDWRIECPKLVANFDYKLSGNFIDMLFDDEGTGEHVRTDYSINCVGDYTITTGDDGQYTLQFTLSDGSFESNGDQTFKMTGMSEDKVEYINKNSETMDKEVCQGVMMQMLATTFVPNMNDFLQHTSMQELFYEIEN